MSSLYGSQKRLVWLWLTLAEFGTPPEFRTLDDRIELQKLVYLAQAATGATSYHFNPYIRGPYSPLLTRDLYGLLEPGRMEEVRTQASSYRLPSSSLERLERARSVAKERNSLRYVKWLELVASMHQKYEDTAGDFNEVWEEVREWKGDIFSESEASTAWDSLVRNRLVAE